MAFARAFRWPPDVTRRQSLRDLTMLLESMNDKRD